MRVIGADEVGSGDTFCGLVVSAVCLTEEQSELLRLRNLRDCKKIADSKIGQYVGLMTEIGVRHSTVALDPDRFNDLLGDNRGHVEIQNIMYARAIGNLIQKVGPPDRVLVDQYPGANVVLDHQNIEMVPRADETFLSVAAASIMARSAYLGMRKSLGKELGMQIPLGSSNVREALKQLISMEVDISRYAKLYPNNVQAILRESQ
jgi:ribonuclease HIII